MSRNPKPEIHNLNPLHRVQQHWSLATPCVQTDLHQNLNHRNLVPENSLCFTMVQVEHKVPVVFSVTVEITEELESSMVVKTYLPSMHSDLRTKQKMLQKHAKEALCLHSIFVRSENKFTKVRYKTKKMSHLPRNSTMYGTALFLFVEDN